MGFVAWQRVGRKCLEGIPVVKHVPDGSAESRRSGAAVAGIGANRPWGPATSVHLPSIRVCLATPAKEAVTHGYWLPRASTALNALGLRNLVGHRADQKVGSVSSPLPSLLDSSLGCKNIYWVWWVHLSRFLSPFLSSEANPIFGGAPWSDRSPRLDGILEPIQLSSSP